MRALLYCAGGGIGDSLVASVVARALHARYEAVDALTLPGHRETLERVPDLDRVLVDEGGDARELAASLQNEAYDACVVTWATPRTATVPQLAKIPVRVGQARRLYSFRFTHRVTVRSETGDVTSHWADILLDYARALGCDTQDKNYRFVPTEEDIAAAERCQPESFDFAQDKLRANGGRAADEAFIILNPCNAIASKCGIWPVEGWSALARALAERYDVPILVSGSPADKPYAEKIARPSSTALRACAQEDRGRIVSIAGELGIGAFGALAQRAKAFVGITTGSMHVAAAVGCPTVGIFPFQTDYPERWAPLGKSTAVVRPSYPCHKGDTKENCRDYACVENLDVPRILAAAESLQS